jgi:hypothetical protein
METEDAASSATTTKDPSTSSTDKVKDSPLRPPRQTDRKISAPSPPRRGIKLFGRK